MNYRPVKPEDTEEGFGKSVPKTKVSKKSKKEKEKIEIVDSTEKIIEPTIVPNKKEKKSKSASKNEKQEKGKAIQPSTDSVNYRPDSTEPIIKDSSVNEFGKKPDSKKKKRG